MSLIQCTCDCLYQKDGYCKLDKAAEVTNQTNSKGCLHYIAKKSSKTENNKNHSPQM